MQRVATGSQVVSLPAPNADSGTPGFFNNAAPGIGIVPTVPGPDWFNRVQEELVAPILGTGQALSDSAVNQLLLAIKRLARSNVTTVTASLTLTPDEAGLVLVSAAAGNVVVTMPANNSAGAIPLGYRFVRTDATANTVTFATTGSDTFDSVAWTAVTAPPLVAGFPLEVTGDGVSHWAWWLSGGASLLSADGWEKIFDPNAATGLRIRQWGTATITIPTSATFTKMTVSFPIAFPTAVLNVRATQGGFGVGTTQPLNGDGSVSIALEDMLTNNPTLTGFDLWGWDSTDTGKQDVQWEAIGH